MHPFVLIPLLSTVAAAALAAAVWVRDPKHSSNRLVAALLVATGWWSLCQTLWNTAAGPEEALRFARWSSIGSMALGPLAFHVVLCFRPVVERRFRVPLTLTYAAAALGWVTAVATPTVVESVVRTGWGWSPVGGPANSIFFAALAPGPIWAIASSVRRSRREPSTSLRHAHWLPTSVAVPFAIATVTDFVLPTQGIRFPRLGCTSLILWGGLVWWAVYRFQMPILSPQRFAREILAALPNGVVLVRTDGRIRMTNAAVDRLLHGRSHVGQPIQDLLEHPDRPAAEGEGRPERECTLRTGPEERVPVSVSTSPLADRDGRTVGYVLALRDVREVVSLRSRLLTSGRLAAVGQLAAGIAHEINNPVAYVRSNLAMLERHWAAVPDLVSKSGADPELAAVFEDGADLLRESVEGIDRVASIVRDVGGFARQGPAEHEMADLAELLDTAVRVAGPQLRHRVEVERDYASLPLVSCMPREMMQVFLNLVLNAAQSLGRDGGTGTIRLVTRADERGVTVRVEDDGPGIAPEAAARLFDPFFTTKPVGEGTGLGLAISRQIVERHGGEIDFSQRSGGGAVFRIRLPLPSGETEA